MNRIKRLNLYQKIILLVLAAMLLLFGVLYGVITTQVGVEYNNAILVPREENGSTVYAGKIRGVEAVFIVTPENVVTFRYGENRYGPYTAVEDASAIPPDDTISKTGVELRKGAEIIFRGGVRILNDGEKSLLLFSEDGSHFGPMITFTNGDGTIRDADGNVIDPMEPSAWTILSLMNGPVLTSKGDWLVFFWSVVLSVIMAGSILYAEELFRWNLSLMIRDAEHAEPTEWQIFGRYMSWTFLTAMILGLYIMGLTGL